MDVLRQLLEDARGVIKDMTATQRIAVAAMVVTVASLLFFVVWIGGTQEKQGYAALPRRVDPKDSTDLKQKLEEAGYGPARYDLQTKTVSVPANQLEPALIYLAGEGLLADDTGGFAVWLEKQQFSDPKLKTDRMMKLALENEMSRLIETIDVVKQAKVIYSERSRKSLFGPHYRQRASVLVTTRLGQEMSQKTAETIIALVSAARPGLEPTGVQVSDQHGKHFYARDPDSLDRVSATRFELQSKQNDAIRDKVEALVRRAIPGSEAFAFVDFQLNMDKRLEQKRQYSEGPKHHERTRKYSEQSVERPPAEVGTRPNIARAAELASGSPYRELNISEKEADRTYQNNITDLRTEYAPDRERLTISVVVHLPYRYREVTDAQGQPVLDDEGNPVRERVSEPPRSDEEIAAIERSIQSAAGILSGEANTNVEIIQVPWKPPLEREMPGKTTGERFREWVIANVLPLTMIGILLFSVWLIYQQAKRALPSEEEERLMVEEPSAAMPMMPELSDVDKANAQFEQLRGKVADLVEEDPRRAAGLVRRWMTKENY